MSIGSQGFRDNAIGGHWEEAPSFVAGHPHRPWCAISLVVSSPLCFSEGEFPLACHQTRVGAPICTWARCPSQCLSKILGMPENFCDETTRHAATLPVALRRLGLGGAERSRLVGDWASWVDTLPMIQERHPAVAKMIIRFLQEGPNSPCLVSVQNVALELDGVEGFEVPGWIALAGSLRPEPRESKLHACRSESGLAARSSQGQARAEHILSPLPRPAPCSVQLLASRSQWHSRLSWFLLQLPLALRPCPDGAVCVAVFDAFGHTLGQEFWAGEGSL